ncbi:hypothetical protein SUGI_0989450 [Cryptomeria japonica]|nr:hypothetical protein SUGI_0989450 [Cryptomeria japonica]
MVEMCLSEEAMEALPIVKILKHHLTLQDVIVEMGVDKDKEVFVAYFVLFEYINGAHKECDMKLTDMAFVLMPLDAPCKDDDFFDDISLHQREKHQRESSISIEDTNMISAESEVSNEAKQKPQEDEYAKYLIQRLIYAEGAENGLEFPIARPFNYVGPRMNFFSRIDGTTSMVVLVGELLREAEKLVAKNGVKNQ